MDLEKLKASADASELAAQAEHERAEKERKTKEREQDEIAKLNERMGTLAARRGTLMDGFAELIKAGNPTPNPVSGQKTPYAATDIVVGEPEDRPALGGRGSLVARLSALYGEQPVTFRKLGEEDRYLVEFLFRPNSDPMRPWRVADPEVQPPESLRNVAFDCDYQLPITDAKRKNVQALETELEPHFAQANQTLKMLQDAANDLDLNPALAVWLASRNR